MGVLNLNSQIIWVLINLLILFLLMRKFLFGPITRLLDANNVAWQIGELGRLDLGGGGTIAKYVANRGIPVLDIGVPVLSMHSPFEVIHKTDLYMAYRTFSLFCQAEQ